jgi:Nitrile hydratase, alpha chain
VAIDMQSQEQARKYGQVVARAWSDETFKRRLLAEPAAVLREQGIEVPSEVEVRMVENTDRVVHLVLPPTPAEGELSDEQLDRVAGGFTSMSYCPCQ